MADEEIFDAGMLKPEEIKQENFHGWDAASWILYYLEFYYL